MMATSPELEEAMREAEEAIEAREADRAAGGGRRAGAAPGGAETPNPAPGGAEAPNPEAAGAEAEAKSVAELEAELAQLKDRYLRLAADFENFRRRALKEREEAHHFGHQNLVKDLLPSVDNLERAIDHARKGGEGGTTGLLEGVELVMRELEGVLARHGVTPIDALGQPFDPSLHEAMAQVPDGDHPPNTVVEVFQRGYQLRSRLLRPARVVVSKLPDSGADTGDGQHEG